MLTKAIVHGAQTGKKTLGFSCYFLSLGGQESLPKNGRQAAAKCAT